MNYLYKCVKCGEFEAEHKMAEKLEACPTCGSEVRRLIAGATRFKLLGSGWSQDNYESAAHPRFMNSGTRGRRGRSKE